MRLIYLFAIFSYLITKALQQYPVINKYWKELSQKTLVKSDNYTIDIEFDVNKTSYNGNCEIIFLLQKPTCKVFVFTRKLWIGYIHWETLDGKSINLFPPENKSSDYYMVRSQCQVQKGFYRFIISYMGSVEKKHQFGLFQSDEAFLTNLWPKSANFFFPCFYDDISIFHLSIIVKQPYMSVVAITNITFQSSDREKVVKFEPTPKIPVYMLFFAIYKNHNNHQKSFGPWPDQAADAIKFLKDVITRTNNDLELEYPLSLINVQNIDLVQWFPYNIIPVPFHGKDSEVDIFVKVKLLLRTIFKAAFSQAVETRRFWETQRLEIIGEILANKTYFVDEKLEMQYRVWKSILPSKRADSWLYAWPIRVDNYTQLELTDGQIVKGAMTLEKFIIIDGKSKKGLNKSMLKQVKLSRSSNGNVENFENTWWLQPNHPVVVLEKDPDEMKKYFLTYKRFVLASPLSPVGLNTSPLGSFIWKFTVLIITSFDPRLHTEFEMDPKFKNYVCKLTREPGVIYPDYPHLWMILNPNHLGYFRVLYTTQLWNELYHYFHNLRAIDQATVLDDVFNLAKINEVEYSTALMFFEVGLNCLNGLPLSVLAHEFDFFDRVLSDKLLGNFVKRLINLTEVVQPAIHNCTGFEDCLYYWLQTERFKSLCRMRITYYVGEAFNFLKHWLLEDSDFNPQIKEVAILYGLQNENYNIVEMWGFLYMIYQQNDSKVKREVLLRGLAMVQSENILFDFLSDIVNYGSSHDLLIIIDQMAQYPLGRRMIWRSLKMLTLNSSYPFIDGLLDIVVTIVRTEEEEQKVSKIIEKNFDMFSLDRKYKNWKYKMQFNLEWKKKYEKIINHWIVGKGKDFDETKI